MRLYTSFFDFVARTHPDRDELERLILVGAFDSLHSNRRELLWSIPTAYGYAAYRPSSAPERANACAVDGPFGTITPNIQQSDADGGGLLDLEFHEPDLVLAADFLHHEKAIHERAILGMDVAYHLMRFERGRIAAKGGVLATDIAHLAPGTRCFLVENPIRLRFPPTPAAGEWSFSTSKMKVDLPMSHLSMTSISVMGTQ